MTLTFSWEPLSLLLNEPNIGDLLRAHWEELAVHKHVMPLDPDYQRMLFYEEHGLFKVWAARDGETLAGYLAFIVQPHLHYKSTLTAVEDLFLLAPRYRHGMNGLRLFTTAFEALRELGVKRIICHSKVHFAAERGGLDRMFGRLGFEFTDKLWSKVL